MNSKTTSPLREARKDAYKQVIVDAAERVFAKHGFAATKMQTIADEARIAVGTVYTVFEGKEELFGEVLSRRLPELLKTTAEAAFGARTTFERLTVGLRSYVTYMLEHPDYLRIHLREHAWGLGPTYATPEQKEAWYEGLELETTFLKMGMEEGIVIEEDPFLLARCVTAVHQVQLWNWVEKGMTEPIAQVADRMDRLFLQMFCTAKGQAQQLN